MPEWFLPSRGERTPLAGVGTSARTEVCDARGWCVVVDTRMLVGGDEWETTISSGDPDSPAAGVFAVVATAAEALAAHEQAVDFATEALKSSAGGSDGA